jgi:hypothetical protein
MAEHAREENNGEKNLRRALKQVDRRVVVPESLDYGHLRALIENVEPVTPREKRLPSWLSPQSGLAYAAAFCLVVALVYSTGTHKPDIITGGMAIPDNAAASQAEQDEAAPLDDTARIAAAPEEPQIMAAPEAPAPAPAAAPEPAAALPPQAEEAETLGVGGGNRSALIVEADGIEYRWRPIDASDPDRSGFVSLEAIDTEKQEITDQIDIDNMLAVSQGFAFEEALALVGTFEGSVVVNAYSTAPELALAGLFGQPGELVAARARNGVLHVVSLSDILPTEIDVSALPDSLGGTKSCVITALDLATLDCSQQAFSGASGTIQLLESTVVINYESLGEDGEKQRRIAPVYLAGTEIELGLAS